MQAEKAPGAQPKPGRRSRIGGGGCSWDVPSSCPDRLLRRLLTSPHKQPRATGWGPPAPPPVPTLLLLGLGQKAKASGGSGARLRAAARGCSSGTAMLQHLPRLYGRGRMGESGEEAPCSRTGSPVDWC